MMERREMALPALAPGAALTYHPNQSRAPAA
jgi:hypothetical protein